MTREKAGAKALVNDLAEVLGYLAQGDQSAANVMAKAAREVSLFQYIHMQPRALEALIYFKRYAVSVLKRDASVTQNQDDGIEDDETGDESTDTTAGEQQ
jgi:hypothetical protein